MNVVLEAHRGVSNEYPENTMSALRAARDLGYGMIEVDTKFTKDDQCILLHDYSLNRTARYEDGRELPADSAVCEWTWEEVRRLDAGSWRGERFRGERIPLLQEALIFAKEARIPLKLDNVMWQHTSKQRNQMYDMIEETGALSVVGFTASKLECISELLERFPKAHVHYDGLPDEKSLEQLGQMLPREQLTVWLRQHNANTAWCQTPAATPELAKSARSVATIGLWLITRPEELVAAERLGADWAETDGSLRP